MKNKEIYNLYEGLIEISQDKNLKLDIRISYYLACDRNILEPFYNAIIETRLKIFNKYGESTSQGQIIPPERVEDFKKEWYDFMELDNFVSLRKIKLTEFTGQIGLELMTKLLPIIEE